jgi:hypothetical protein
MTPDEYLEKVLETQKLTEEELEELRDHRNNVEGVLKDHFSDCSPRIRYAGSYKKKTMIREAYDLDVTCYFPHEDDEARKTLKEIYDSVFDALSEKYHVERKNSALRVMEKEAVIARADFRIDVVPGRFTDDSETDVFLHQETAVKERLKTNLQVHVAHIRDSGVRDAIKLMKLWKSRNASRVKTFVLELLVVKLLKQRKTASLKNQLLHVLTEFRDHSEDLAVEDPANSNNDLKPMLDEVRSDLQAWASIALTYIEDDNWEAVFGALPDEGVNDRATVLGRVAASTAPIRPWLPSE